MHIQISAQHFALNEALQSYIHNKLSAHVVKYMNCSTGCDVHFSRINHLFQCEIVLHSGIKITFVSRSSAEDIYESFDICLAKLDKQLIKQSSRLKEHHQEKVKIDLEDADLPLNLQNS